MSGKNAILDVLLMTLDRKKKETVEICADDTVGRLKSRWCDAHGNLMENCVILSAEEKALSNDVKLSEVSNDSSFLRLWVVEQLTVNFRILDQDDSENQLVRVDLSARLDSFYPILRERFHIPANRRFRLLNSDRAPLDETQTFNSIELDCGASVLIDLESDTDSNKERIDGTPQTEQQVISVIEGQVRHQKIAVDTACPNMQRTVIAQVTVGEEMSVRRSFEVKFRLCGVMILQTQTVLVKLPDGRLRKFSVPRDGVLLDLKKNVAESLGKGYDEFRFQFHEQILSDSTQAIRDLHVTNDNYLTVILDQHQLTVQVEDTTLEFPSQKSVNRNHIAQMLLKNGSITRAELERLSFECVGCRRQLLPEKSSHQPIPSNCCDLQSKFLKIRSRKDAASTQFAVRRTVNRSTKPDFDYIAAVSTEKDVKVSASQWTASFCFENYSCLNSGADFEDKVVLQRPMTIKDLATALAVKFEVNVQCFYFEALRTVDRYGNLWIGVQHPLGRSQSRWCANSAGNVKEWRDLLRNREPSFHRLLDNDKIFELPETTKICLVIKDRRI